MHDFKTELTSIQEVLAKNYLDIDSLDSGGFSDIERRIERYFCGLLNLIMDLALMITDPLDVRFSCVNLIDLNARLAVIIDAADSDNQSFLHLFPQRGLNNCIDKLILLKTSLARDPVEQQLEGANITDFPSVEIWGYDAIMDRIKNLPYDKLQEVGAYLHENYLVQAVNPVHTLPALPPASDYFVPGSRDRELSVLIQKLKEREYVFICGVGGIGKTQTAIQLAKRCRPPKGAYFIHCVVPVDAQKEMLRETILAANFSGYRFFGNDNAERDYEYQARLEILRKEYDGAMLIFDNLDWEKKSVEQICAEHAYQDLLNLNLQLVFTTRSPVNQEWGIWIDRLDESTLLKLMRSIIKSANFPDAEFKQLIGAVDKHTLLVYLMAKTIEESWGDVTPKILLDALKSHSLPQESFPLIASDQNQLYSPKSLYAHMSALFDLSSLSEDEHAILRYTTLLPEDGMDESLFLYCLPSWQHQALDSLVRRGLIQNQQSLLTLHSVVREVCRVELSPSDENCVAFLEQLWMRFDLSKDYHEKQFMQIAICFSIASDTLPDYKGLWASYAGRYWEQLGDNQKEQLYNGRVRERYADKESVNPQDYATAYHRFGTTCYQMGDYPGALFYLQKALQVRQSSPAPDFLRLANSYNNIGNIYGEMEDFRKALHYHKEALQIAEGHSLSPLACAQFHTNIGLSYFALDDYDQALKYHQKALAVFEEHLHSTHPDIARSYNNIGLTFDALGKHNSAMSYKLRALKIFEKVLPSMHPEIARAYNSIGSSYSKQENYTKALEYQIKSLEIRESILPPNHPDLAVSCNNVASTYIAMGNYDQARDYALKALEIRQKCLSENPIHLALSLNNLGRISFYMSEYETALKYLQQSLDVLKSVDKDHPYVIDAYEIIKCVKMKMNESTQ